MFTIEYTMRGDGSTFQLPGTYTADEVVTKAAELLAVIVDVGVESVKIDRAR